MVSSRNKFILPADPPSSSTRIMVSKYLLPAMYAYKDKLPVIMEKKYGYICPCHLHHVFVNWTLLYLSYSNCPVSCSLSDNPISPKHWYTHFRCPNIQDFQPIPGGHPYLFAPHPKLQQLQPSGRSSKIFGMYRIVFPLKSSQLATSLTGMACSVTLDLITQVLMSVGLRLTLDPLFVMYFSFSLGWTYWRVLPRLHITPSRSKLPRLDWNLQTALNWQWYAWVILNLDGLNDYYTYV